MFLWILFVFLVLAQKILFVFSGRKWLTRFWGTLRVVPISRGFFIVVIWYFCFFVCSFQIMTYQPYWLDNLRFQHGCICLRLGVTQGIIFSLYYVSDVIFFFSVNSSLIACILFCTISLWLLLNAHWWMAESSGISFIMCKGIA